MNVESSAARYDGPLQAEMGKACVPWPRNVSGRACQAGIEELVNVSVDAQAREGSEQVL